MLTAFGKHKISGVLHRSKSKHNGAYAVVMVGGAGGGYNGPAGMYNSLGKKFQQAGITAVQVDYRFPNQLNDCVEDVIDVVEELHDRYDVVRSILVGWSFGGAVVITAGAMSQLVAGVITVASQTAGADSVSRLTPKPLLLMHGTLDSCLSFSCSQNLYARAKQPKDIILYDEDDHGLSKHSQEATEKIWNWANEVFAQEENNTAYASD